MSEEHEGDIANPLSAGVTLQVDATLQARQPQSAAQDRQAGNSFPVARGFSWSGANVSAGRQALLATLRGDLTLGLRMERCPANVIHLLILQPFCEITRDVAGTVITEQTRFVLYDSLIATRCL
jgi:hypothetical protein